MRGMIIGLSALAITTLPTLALADGNGAVTGAAGGAIAGGVVGGPVGAAVGGAAGGIIGGATSGHEHRPVVVAPPPCSSRSVTRTDSEGNSVTHQATNC
jgi:uncharacterized protein YcfJ